MSENKAIVNDLPFALGTDVIEALARYDRSDFAANYAIGNQPWLSAITKEDKYSRVTTQFQKERIDQGASAGENTLSNWWLRSATSWHRGAGAEFYDADEADLFRFRESANIDVWTQGQLSLLPDTERVFTAGASQATPCALGVWFISAGDLYLYRASTNTVEEVTGFTGVALRLATDGCAALVGAADGLYEVSSTLSVVKLYSPPTGSTTWDVQALGYVKDRIIVCAQITHAVPMRVFELARNPASPPVTVVLADDSRYEYKATSLSFAAVTETTSAILVATNTGIQSRVISFTIDTSTGGNSAMLEPIVVAEFPIGEVIRTMKSYLSTYVVTATNRGVRVGEESQNGLGLTYGPLTVKDDVYGLAFNGEFVYATRRVTRLGVQGLWRIDLGMEVGDGFAYAADLSITNEAPTSVAFIGTTGRALITTASSVFVQHATRKAESGYLASGLIRFGTTERKQPVSAAVRSGVGAGTLGISISDSGGAVAGFESLPVGGTLNIPVSAELQPTTEFEVTITMNRDSSGGGSPVLEEWQLRALPAPVRSRTITVPLMLMNEERDANGVIRTSDPWKRLQALEQLEQSGGACMFQDFSTGEERICVIRAVQFDQVNPQSFTQGFSGVVTVQLQTVDVEI